MGVEMAFEMVVENAADAARDAAVGQPEIFVGPFRKARIEGRVVGRAGGAQPGVERLGVLVIGDRRVEVGAAAEPALAWWSGSACSCGPRGRAGWPCARRG